MEYAKPWKLVLAAQANAGRLGPVPRYRSTAGTLRLASDFRTSERSLVNLQSRCDLEVEKIGVVMHLMASAR